MREVSKQTFFKRIFNDRLNVHPHITTGFPYTSVWKYSNNPLAPPYGKTVDTIKGGVVLKTYFLATPED